MASLHNMLMAGTVVGDDRIEVKSSFFGLCKTAVYQPTGSKLTAVILEFPQDRAGELNRIMQTPDEELPAVVQETGKLVEKSLGNVRLEDIGRQTVCRSPTVPLQRLDVSSRRQHPLLRGKSGRSHLRTFLILY